MTRLFGTDGVRGVANSELTPELAFRLGEAAGHFLGDKGRGRIVVGRDTRRSGADARGRAGRRHHVGWCRRPACAGSYRRRPSRCSLASCEADGGVVISASHNPPEYNGIKFFSREGFKLPDDLEDEIEEFTHQRARRGSVPSAVRSAASSTVEDAVERYVAHAVDTHRGRPRRGCASPSTAVTARRPSPRRWRCDDSAPRSSRSTTTGTAWTSTSGAARRTWGRCASSIASSEVDLGSRTMATPIACLPSTRTATRSTAT